MMQNAGKLDMGFTEVLTFEFGHAMHEISDITCMKSHSDVCDDSNIY